ncbi:MAG: hypothetical protein IJD58_09190, partial [Lachnospiraceae bacterium]|nr:hypothetical protein [Lachnospiraceae bacterium]MBQ2982274.1 hypothetical protein [Lachnospiraceae bacterium]
MKDIIGRFSLSFHPHTAAIMPPAEYVRATLAIPLRGNKPRRKLRRQATNKHLQGVGNENRKSSK